MWVSFTKRHAKCIKLCEICVFNPNPDQTLYEIHVFDIKSRDLTKGHVKSMFLRSNIHLFIYEAIFAKIDEKGT